MSTSVIQQGAWFTRDARAALLELKALIDEAADKIHAAELETIGLAISGTHTGDAPPTLLGAAETLRSPRFEVAIQQARAKMDTALAWHLPKERAASSR